MPGGAFYLYFSRRPHREITHVLHDDGAAAVAVNINRGITSALQAHLPPSAASPPATGGIGHGAGNFQQKTEDDPKLVEHFEGLLRGWCEQIEGFLAEESTGDSGSDQGPMTELDYWRRRMQKLNNILEQLKTRECKTVMSVLGSLTKSTTDEKTRSIFQHLRRWKQIDIKITEAANESKDNVKYLATLEKFLEPLYDGTPSTIVDTLPALLNSIKMIHTIARSYNTTERMTTLFNKITNQMIANCKASILGGEGYALGRKLCRTARGL